MPLLNYWDDLDADFLRFYGIDISDPTKIEAARFFKLAVRLFAYDGVLSARVRSEQESQGKKTPTPNQGASSREVVHLEPKQLALVEPDIIDFK